MEDLSKILHNLPSYYGYFDIEELEHEYEVHFVFNYRDYYFRLPKHHRDIWRQIVISSIMGVHRVELEDFYNE